MNTRNKTRAMVESALIIVIAVALAFIGMYIPFLSVLSMLLPVPFVIIGVKYGLRYNIISLVAAMILTSSFSSIIIALANFIIVGLSSTTMTYMIRKKASFSKTVFFSVVSSLLALLLIVTIVFAFGGVDISERFEEALKLSDEINKQFFDRIEISQDQIDEITKMQTALMERMLMIIPTAMIFTFTLATFVNYAIVAGILRRINYHIEKPGKFSHFILPKNIFMGTIVIALLTYGTRFFKFVNFEALALNVVFILSMIYLIQGLAVESYFIDKLNISKGLRRTILVFSFFILVNILPYVGLFDVMLDIRKLES